MASSSSFSGFLFAFVFLAAGSCTSRGASSEGVSLEVPSSEDSSEGVDVFSTAGCSSAGSPSSEEVSSSADSSEGEISTGFELEASPPRLAVTLNLEVLDFPS